MANKNFWLGMPVMLLVFGSVLMISCGREDGSATIIVRNEREQSITVRVPAPSYSYDASVTDADKNVDIEKGGSKIYNVAWSNTASNGTRLNLTLYINNGYNSVNANHGKTTTVTAKDDGTVSIVE